MPSIHILPPVLAARIAAGEVTERPASVIKELIENALDAHALHIVIKLEDAGKALIECIDDGDGMDAEDLALCMERHATSKIKHLEDLLSIHTLGFRGEALGSIRAVADTSISSGKNASYNQIRSTSWESHLQLRAIEPRFFIHEPHGTHLRIESLFAQTPARLKFLKKNAVEVTAVKDCMERLAIVHPECAFELHSDQRNILFYPTESQQSRIERVLVSNERLTLIEKTHSDAGMQVTILWAKDVSLPHSRKIFSFVNERPVRDPLIQRAILAPFRQRLMPGSMPAIVCLISMPPDMVDVNVHPHKLEVHFSESTALLQLIRNTIEDCFMQQPITTPSFVSPTTPWTPPTITPISPPFVPYELMTQPSLEIPHFPHGRYRGALFDTYLVFEKDGKLTLVDQHAAHERIRFEELEKQFHASSIISQQLLFPEHLNLPPPALVTMLEKNGFCCEESNQELLITAIPAAWRQGGDIKARLHGLIARLEADESIKDEPLFEALASEACHSSIRAGDTLHIFEAEELITQLFACDHPWNCPHGRLTIYELNETTLSKWFQRT